MAQYAGNLGTYLRVLYDYKYKGHDAADIEIRCGDECLLLKKTTAEWWYVLKHGDRKPIYVPSNYVEEIHKTVISVDDGAEHHQVKVQRAAPEVPKKKKIPPKAPPKPSKLIRKRSDEEAILKELDSILEHAFDGEPIVEEDEAGQPSSGEKEKRESAISSRTNSLQRNSDVFETVTSERKDSNENTIGGKTNTHNVLNTNESAIPVPFEPEPDYDISGAPSQTNGQSAVLQSSVSQSSDHAVDSGISEGSIEGLDKKTEGSIDSNNIQKSHDSLEQEIPSDNNSNPDEEQPEYENFNYVQDTIQRKSKLEDDTDQLPDYANLSEIQAKIFADPPPSEPPPGAPPVRAINEWEEHKDIATGRSYYFNKVARDSTWHAPFCFVKKRESVPNSQEENARNTQQVTPVVNLPRGWTEERTDDGLLLYVNEQTQEKWRSSMSPTGKTYFYNEVSGESLWELPEIAHEEEDEIADLNTLPQDDSKSLLRKKKTQRSMTAPTLFENDEARSDFVSHHERPRIQSVYPMFHKTQELKDTVKRCKVAENGKKANKSWSECYAVLGAGKLCLFKNQKAANPKSGAPKPEMELDLAGATLEIGSKDKKDKARKYVLSIATTNKSEIVLQLETESSRNSWHEGIMSNIYTTQEDLEIAASAVGRASQGKDSQGKSSQGRGSQSSLDAGSLDRKQRKVIPASGRASPLSTATDELTSERAGRIRVFLYKWLFTRPSMESLREKGIIKDAVFGNHLHRICDKDGCNVPFFVTRVINSIEKRGLTTDGIYRVSGNMAEIQRLRLLVDSGSTYNLDNLDWEVHVLTGALKMFFRELKEPLIPFIFYTKFLQANQVDKSSKTKAFRDLIKQMPPSNRETISDLMFHLNKVVVNSAYNRMQHQNLAIVFGPTLMWPENDTQHLAISMVQSAQIIEYFLLEQAKLFT